jgi:hypothetical protein
MATFDLTASSTAGVGANVSAELPAHNGNNMMFNVEAYLDVAKFIAAGNSVADGDIFQLLEIPAGTLVLNAGAEVMTAFTASVTADIDFAAGDDIIDGADVTSTGFCAKGTNGQTNQVITNAASTYTQFITTTDTIDVKLAGAAAAVGILRVYALCINCNANGTYPTSAARDILA